MGLTDVLGDETLARAQAHLEQLRAHGDFLQERLDRKQQQHHPQQRQPQQQRQPFRPPTQPRTAWGTHVAAPAAPSVGMKTGSSGSSAPAPVSSDEDAVRRSVERSALLSIRASTTNGVQRLRPRMRALPATSSECVAKRRRRRSANGPRPPKSHDVQRPWRARSVNLRKRRRCAMR